MSACAVLFEILNYVWFAQYKKDKAYAKIYAPVIKNLYRVFHFEESDFIGRSKIILKSYCLRVLAMGRLHLVCMAWFTKIQNATIF